MGKRREYPQMIAVDICSCGSQNISCRESRCNEGIRFRKKVCLDCGRVFYTREVAEEEWRHLFEFKQTTMKTLKENEKWMKQIYGANG